MFLDDVLVVIIHQLSDRSRLGKHGKGFTVISSDNPGDVEEKGFDQVAELLLAFCQWNLCVIANDAASFKKGLDIDLGSGFGLARDEPFSDVDVIFLSTIFGICSIDRLQGMWAMGDTFSHTACGMELLFSNSFFQYRCPR